MEQKEIPHMPADSIQPDAQQKQEYEQYVKSVTPTHNLWTQMGKAFLTGGIICCIGQGILNYTGNVLGMDPQTSGSWCSLLLVFLSVVSWKRIVYPQYVPSSLIWFVINSETLMAAMRLGWVIPMTPDSAYPASLSIKGICVVFPLPVGLSTTMTWLSVRACRI